MRPEDLEDLFRPVGPVKVRRLFGGQGVVADGVTFAIEFDGEVYLKADAESAVAFEAAGSRQFSYESSRGRISVGFWTMPEAAHEDPDELLRWALPALEFARRWKAARPARNRKSKPGASKLRRRSTV
jgi:DNA transformation protein